MQPVIRLHAGLQRQVLANTALIRTAVHRQVYAPSSVKRNQREREMAYSLYLAGLMKDVTMTDLISGRETLEDVNMIVYRGGFSNSTFWFC